ncbi:MAG: hypothetical protein R2776_04845 [Flavobacteriaceae bacterium]|nr:hypothetical protein [Flavobacteriaceae bacterium]
MKQLVIYKRNILYGMVFLIAGQVSAQNKYKESFKASNDMVVEVNTSYTNVIFETWNKDMVEVEAFVDGKDLSEKEKKEIFDHWKFDVLGNSKKVVITSNPNHYGEGIGLFAGGEALKSLKALKSLDKIPELKSMPDFDFKFNFDIPEVPEFKKIPAWPFTKEHPSIKNKDGYKNYNSSHEYNIQFDQDEYNKDKAAYVAKLNKKYNTHVSVKQVDNWLDEVDQWGEEFGKVMEAWGENFGNKFEMQFGPEFEKKMEKWGEEFGEKFGKDVEAWGEQFGKDMEKWGEEFGEKFGKDMEKWGEEFGKNMEEWAKQFEENGEDGYSYKIIVDENGNKNYNIEGNKAVFSGKANKTIIVRMPKGTKTEVNVKYGELKMANAYNVKATLNYSPLTANSIDGGQTLINASYAPVHVNNWNNGALKVNYVEDCRINTVSEINLQSNSSDVSINELVKNGVLSGSFGNLYVLKIAPDFTNMNITLENADAAINLPNSAFDFYYSGKKSQIKHPKALQLSETKNFDKKILKGKTNASGKTITITASYSNITMQ